MERHVRGKEKGKGKGGGDRDLVHTYLLRYQGERLYFFLPLLYCSTVHTMIHQWLQWIPDGLTE